MSEFLLDISSLRIIFALTMLAIASVLDIWKREIHDYLWIGFGTVAVVLIFFEPNMSDALKSTGISLIIVPLALAIWRFGIVGGADALGLIVLGGLAPLATISDNAVSPFTTLTNAALLSTITLIANAVRNLITISRNQNIFEGFEETRIK
ncbi:MAG: prepilin peptidase, partial [Nitrosopumilaceae archaeon]